MLGLACFCFPFWTTLDCLFWDPKPTLGLFSGCCLLFRLVCASDMVAALHRHAALFVLGMYVTLLAFAPSLGLLLKDFSSRAPLTFQGDRKPWLSATVCEVFRALGASLDLVQSLATVP